jgi:hypothetical protein
MNGFSLIFAVVLIITVGAISGVVMLMLLGGLRHVPTPPWRKRKPAHSALAGHHE